MPDLAPEDFEPEEPMFASSPDLAMTDSVA